MAAAARQITPTTEPSLPALREAWLVQLANLMRPEIERRAGVTFPPFRVTCGFPSRGGELGRKTRVRGQCWSAGASEDQHAEIFISPVEDDVPTVAAILAHEMIHAALPTAGHKAPFQRAARAIGHMPPFTSSEPTSEFMAWAGPLADFAGTYPHRRLNALVPVAQPKKQSVRLLKAECGDCGYTVRVTRKWIDQVGAPHCPMHGEMSVDGIDGAGGEDDQ